MADYLCLSINFLDRQFHGRADGGEPEWPPSPLRLFQAIVAAGAAPTGDIDQLVPALRWFERLSPPTIIAPAGCVGQAYRLSVPNNAMDLVVKAWAKGNYHGSGDASPATHRTMKAVRPIHLLDSDQVHYYWEVPPDLPDKDRAHLDLIRRAVRSIVALGWGVDLVVADGRLVGPDGLEGLSGERWVPALAGATTTLRVPASGTLDALCNRHRAFLNRVADGGFTPVAPLKTFRRFGYRRSTDPVPRPYAIFELRNDDDTRFGYPQSRLIHVAGMVRHLAIKLLTASPPNVADPAEWIESYVAGHRSADAPEHRQLSYMPLPSIGTPHTDPAVRRLMIVAPVGDDHLLEHLARLLSGQSLIATPETRLQHPPILARYHQDSMSRLFTGAFTTWASVTPVILPGHDDHKPAKTQALIERALRQAGIEQACEYEWSAFSWFPKALSSHKYGRDKRPTGYIRPDHLLTQTAVHLKLQFDREIPGPVLIGAGRHCGLGIFAALGDS